MSRQCTPFWSLELYALGVAPCGCTGPSLVVRLTTAGSVSYKGCWPTGVWGWVLGPLVGKRGSWVTGDSEAPMANDLLLSEAVTLPG